MSTPSYFLKKYLVSRCTEACILRNNSQGSPKQPRMVWSCRRCLCLSTWNSCSHLGFFHGYRCWVLLLSNGLVHHDKVLLKHTFIKMPWCRGSQVKVQHRKEPWRLVSKRSLLEDYLSACFDIFADNDGVCRWSRSCIIQEISKVIFWPESIKLSIGSVKIWFTPSWSSGPLRQGF